MARSSMSMQSTGALLATVVVVSIALFGLLLILLDATVFRPGSEAARLRAEERHAARLGLQLVREGEPASEPPAAESPAAVPASLHYPPLPTPMPSPDAAVADAAVVLLVAPGSGCGGVGPEAAAYADGGRDPLLETYHNARAGKRATTAAVGPKITLTGGAPGGSATAADYRRAAMARAGAAALVAMAARKRARRAGRASEAKRRRQEA